MDLFEPKCMITLHYCILQSLLHMLAVHHAESLLSYFRITVILEGISGCHGKGVYLVVTFRYTPLF